MGMGLTNQQKEVWQSDVSCRKAQLAVDAGKLV